jgi:hypothetical protein
MGRDRLCRRPALRLSTGGSNSLQEQDRCIHDLYRLTLCLTKVLDTTAVDTEGDSPVVVLQLPQGRRVQLFPSELAQQVALQQHSAWTD